MKNSSTDEDLSIFAMQVATSSIVPRALKAVIELDLLEMMKKAGRPLSTSEMAAQIQATNPEAALMIDRILRVLIASNILECTTAASHGGAERLYSLAPVCKFFTKNDDGVSWAPLFLMIQDRVFTEAWDHVKDAIVEGGIPFNIAHGMSGFEYPATDPRYNKIFNQAMSDESTMFMHKILELYDGFDGLKSVVDVGGGIGASLKMIITKYPSIQAINFDLPHVIQNAPSHPGLEHRSGDMFVSVPTGDAILLKWIIHNWSDGHCLKLLKNCYEALPEKGKVIIADRILPETENYKEASASVDLAGDALMLTLFTGGKERAEAEFQALAKASGFKHFRKVCCAFSTWIMELYK
uniref:O-methyltransferase 3 n=1 Tax=Perilla frutescens TaxID=48386 RepID=A0A866VYG3_PERFR|nr:O-methyltransferase 3 [Perilla frutescens]